MEWVTGVKLSLLPSDEIRTLSKVGQEAFLTQLLDCGYFHGDPHPGNLLKITAGPEAGKLALLDFGLVAEIPEHDREAVRFQSSMPVLMSWCAFLPPHHSPTMHAPQMVAATIHLANRDWDALCGDFTALGFIPPDADRSVIIPVMDRVLSPYLRGGGR